MRLFFGSAESMSLATPGAQGVGEPVGSPTFGTSKYMALAFIVRFTFSRLSFAESIAESIDPPWQAACWQVCIGPVCNVLTTHMSNIDPPPPPPEFPPPAPADVELPGPAPAAPIDPDAVELELLGESDPRSPSETRAPHAAVPMAMAMGQHLIALVVMDSALLCPSHREGVSRGSRRGSAGSCSRTTARVCGRHRVFRRREGPRFEGRAPRCPGGRREIPSRSDRAHSTHPPARARRASDALLPRGAPRPGANHRPARWPVRMQP